MHSAQGRAAPGCKRRGLGRRPPGRLQRLRRGVRERLAVLSRALQALPDVRPHLLDLLPELWVAEQALEEILEGPRIGGRWAHAFVSRSEPRAGATLGESPAQIRIWFDGPVEPVSIDIRVENANQRRVGTGDGRLSPADNRLVEVGLPPLSPGRYRVFWSVVARDGHRREGTFSFLVK